MTHRTRSRALAVILPIAPAAGIWIACSHVAQPQQEQTLEPDRDVIGFADPDRVPRGSLEIDLGDALPSDHFATRGSQYIEGYTNKKSYRPGDVISFHVSTTSPTYEIDIRIEESWRNTRVAFFQDLPGSHFPQPTENAWQGALWPETFSVTVPATWETGSYLAKFRTEDGTFIYHPFAILPSIPGESSRLVMVMNYPTRQAYNSWGGKNVYASQIEGDDRHAVRVSFLRPFDAGNGRGSSSGAQWGVTAHLESNGYAPEYLTERDIHENPGILRAYDVIVLSAHHEYISRPVYDALQAHHDRGGHLAFFSANDLWWQVRYEDDNQTMVAYRQYAMASDPYVGVDDTLVTTRWDTDLLGRPGERLQGTTTSWWSPDFEWEDYIVQMSSHWMFEGTGLQNGDVFGELLASGEQDYLGPHSPEQIDVVLGARRTVVREGRDPPVDYVDVAATYYARSPEYGFPDGNGAQVFSAGTVAGWCNGLFPAYRDHEVVRLVTNNILGHMLAAAPPSIHDFDFDRDVDLLDFAYVQTCLHHAVPASPLMPCAQVDSNANGVAGLDDYRAFEDSMTGPG